MIAPWEGKGRAGQCEGLRISGTPFMRAANPPRSSLRFLPSGNGKVNRKPQGWRKRWMNSTRGFRNFEFAPEDSASNDPGPQGAVPL